MTEKNKQTIEQLKHFAKTWNALYATEKFEEMKYLATEDVGIANAEASTCATGLIYGRQAYYDGIYNAYYGASGTEKNLLVMKYEEWEYIPLNNDNTFFYTIGRYTLQPNVEGVNCWLLRRDTDGSWRIFRVINT